MMVILCICILLIFRYMWYRLHAQCWYINHFLKNAIYHHLSFRNFNILIFLFFLITDQEDNICVRGVIRCAYVLWSKLHNIGEYFAWAVTSLSPFSDRVWFVKSRRQIFAWIITNKWVMLPLFEAAPPNVTPIASSFFTKLAPPSNTDLNIQLSRSC